MKTKYKYFKDFYHAFAYYGKSVAWYYTTDFGIRYTHNDIVNGEPARRLTLYNKETGEVLVDTELHLSLCGKYVVIIRDFR